VEREYAWPEGHWNWPIRLSYKHGVGSGTDEDWELAARVRARYFQEPGPAATGIPVPTLAYEGMMTEIEVIAKVGS
jgi:hypothetical protein